MTNISDIPDHHTECSHPAYKTDKNGMRVRVGETIYREYNIDGRNAWASMVVTDEALRDAVNLDFYISHAMKRQVLAWVRSDNG
jgi:hypothetical protein